MKCILDIEASGLMGTPDHHMHCAVFRDIETGKVYKFSSDNRVLDGDVHWTDPLFRFLDNCTRIICHNGTTFDMCFLDEVYDWRPGPDVDVDDTLIMSRVLNPDRPPVHGTRAPHSVEAWGKRLGRWKPDHSDWSVFTPEMLHRCTEDTEIQYLMFLQLCKEADIKDPTQSIYDPKNYGDHNWALALEQEHKSARIMYQQQVNGCYFKKEEATEFVEVLQGIVDDKDEAVLKYAVPAPKQKGTSINKPFKKDGNYTKATCDWYDHLNYCETPDVYLEDMFSEPQVEGPFSRVEWNELNLGSDVQLKKWLLSIGWKPDEWNWSKKEFDSEGQPLRMSAKLTESSYTSLPDGIGQDITARSKARHRRSQIQGWLGHLREDGRLEGQANPQGTPTGRMKHRLIANVPKPVVDKKTHQLVWYPKKQDPFFGTEMRSLFSCPDDRVLVGRDASGLELRCFAHYLNDDTYTDTLLNGDIHVYNQELAGLPTRDNAKTFIYAFLYGAGAGRLGEIILPDGTEAQRVAAGKELKSKFLAANPKLSKLIKGVQKASGRGWLLGIDGRKLMMRTMHGQIQKNKALNTLLQGAGALVMTTARIWLWEEVAKHKELSGALKVLDYHDEETWECLPEQAELLKETMVQSVRESGLFYKFNLPLDADARIGSSWASIH